MIYDRNRAIGADFRPPREGTYTPGEAPVPMGPDPETLGLARRASPITGSSMADDARRLSRVRAMMGPAPLHHETRGQLRGKGTPDQISRRRQVVGRLIVEHREAAHLAAEAASRAHAEAAMPGDPDRALGLTEAGILLEAVSEYHLRRLRAARTEMQSIYGIDPIEARPKGGSV